MKKIILGLLLAAISLPAYAWGAREQGLLTGMVVGSMIHHHPRHFSHYNPPIRYYSYPPSYVAPLAPAYTYVQPINPQVIVIDNSNCRRVPVLDQNNQIIAYSQVCQNPTTQVTE